MRNLIQAIHEFTQTILNPFDLDELLHRVTGHATAVLEAAGSGIMLADDAGVLRLVAASRQTVVEAERHQPRIVSGACHEAFTTNKLISIDDIEGDDRWPAYRDRVLALGLRSVMVVPMNAFGQIIGVINVYRDDSAGWSSHDQEAGEIMAAMGAGYILNAHQLQAQYTLTEQLQVAIESRDIIGQAKGILMAQGNVDSDQAFELLRERSQADNRKLRDVAKELVDRQHDSIEPAAD